MIGELIFRGFRGFFYGLMGNCPFFLSDPCKGSILIVLNFFMRDTLVINVECESLFLSKHKPSSRDNVN